MNLPAIWKRILLKPLTPTAKQANNKLNVNQLEDRLVPAPLVISANLAYGSSQVWDSTVEVQGQRIVTIDGDLTINQASTLFGDGSNGTLDNLTINSTGKVTINGLIGGAGLNDLRIIAQGGIELNYTGTLLANQKSVNITGDFSLEATANPDFAAQNMNIFYNTRDVDTTITVGNAVVNANNIVLLSKTDSSKYDEMRLSPAADASMEANKKKFTGSVKFGHDGTGAFVERQDNASFTTDGFVPAMEVGIADSKDKKNDYLFKILSVSADGKKLYLEETAKYGVTNQTDASTTTISEVVAIQNSDAVYQRYDKNGNPVGTTTSVDSMSAAGVFTVIGNGIANALGMITPARVLESNTSSTISVGANAKLTAVNDLSINSESKTVIESKNMPIVIGVNVAMTKGVAKVDILSGAILNAGKNFALGTKVENTLKAEVSGGIKPYAAVAYGKQVSKSEATVQSGATINAGNVVIESTIENESEVKAEVDKLVDNSVGIGLTAAVLEQDSASKATVNGSITASGANGTDGDVKINSESVNKERMVSTTSEVRTAPSTTDKLKKKVSDAAMGTGFVQAMLGKLPESVKNKLTAESEAPDVSTLDAAAAVTVMLGSNDADATIGSNAIIKAERDATVTTKAEDYAKTIALANSDASAKLSFGGAVAVHNFTNSADTTVANGAQVDAKRDTTVDAKAIQPNPVIRSASLFANLPSTVQKNWNNAGSTGQSAMSSSFSPTGIFGAQLSAAIDPIADLGSRMGNNLGVPELWSSTFVGAAASAVTPKDDNDTVNDDNRYSIAGTVEIQNMANTANAKIDTGALVNQDTNYQPATPTQNVNVKADATVETVKVIGLFELSNIAKSASQGANGAAGGTVSMQSTNNSAVASIGDNAKVSATGDVNVESDTKVWTVTVGAAGAKSHGYTLSGNVGLNDFTNTSKAFIEDHAQVTAGDDVSVKADNDNFGVIVSVTKSQAGKIGAGVGVAINDFDNTTKAFIGNEANPTGSLLTGFTTANDDIDVLASSKEQLIGVAVAGTLTSDKTPDASVAGASDPADGGSAGSGGAAQGAQPETGGAGSAKSAAQARGGIAISGNVIINTISDTTHAYTTGNVTATTGDVNIKANNDGFAVNVGGSVALSTTMADGGISIAGAYTQNSWTRDVQAYTAGGTITAGGLTTVDAKSDDDLYTITAGAGGSKRGSAVGGSVTLNDFDTTVKAQIGATTVASAGGVTVHADNDQNLLSISGALAASGSSTGGAVGAGVDVGIMNNDVQAIIGTTANVSSSVGSVTVYAENEVDIVGVAASVVGSKNLGFNGAASSQNIDNTVKALAGGTISADQNLIVDSRDDVAITAVGGSATFGSKAGVGASLGNVNIDRVQEAAISAGANITAKGNGTSISLPGNQLSGQGVFVNANANDDLTTVGAGGAGSQNLALAGSAAVNTIDSSVKAYIGDNAQVNVGATGLNTAQSVQVRANNTTENVTVGGALAVSAKAGIGAAAAVEVIDKTIEAYIGTSADVVAANNVTVNASSKDTMTDVAAGVAGSAKVGIAGSAVVLTHDVTTKASINSGATVTADGNVAVQALKQQDFNNIAGTISVGGSVAFGASNTTVVKTDVTEATIAGTANVQANGNSGTIDVYTGEFDSNGNPTTQATRGVAVTAASRDKFVDVAAGAAGAGTAGVAGSVTVAVLDLTTRASIADGAIINGDQTNAANAQSVIVDAGSSLTRTGVAGSAGFGGTAGVGAGIDVATITKVTEATVGGTVDAKNNVIVNAEATEKLVSVGGAIAGGGTAGVAGTTSVTKLTQTTRAKINDNATVLAEGSVAVTADNQTNVTGVAGNAAVGGTAGVGASVGVFIQTKTTEAVIGDSANVTGKANRSAITGNLGTFQAPTYTTPAANSGEQTAPTLSGVNTDSPAIGKVRSIDPATGSFTGVLVTATNRDNISTVAVSGAAGGTFGMALAAGVNIQNVSTNATVGTNAQINTAVATGIGSGQNVRIAAANDHYHLGVGGAASGGGTGAGSPGADVSVITHNTKATVGTAADIDAANNVQIVAENNAEILSIAVAAAVSGTVSAAGGVSVTKLTTNTQAFLGNNTTVDAGGNVIVQAKDETETDAITGAGAIGVGGGGVGGAVAVVNITKDTFAKIGTLANVDAKANSGTFSAYTGDMDSNGNFTSTTGQGVLVQAYSREDAFNVAVSGAGGYAGGLAGAVVVTTTNATTQAIIDSSSIINSDTSGVNSEQSVYVNAANDVKIESYTGALAGGLYGGLSGGVDVGLVRNSVNAQIGNNANVKAANDVEVHAIANRDLKSLSISAAAGAVGIAGAVSVYAVGGGAGSDGTSSLNSNSGNGTTVGGYVGGQSSQSEMQSLVGGFNTTTSEGTRPNANNLVQSATTSATSSMTSNLSIDASSAIASTTTITGTIARVGTNATLTAGDDVNVSAKERLRMDLTAGSGSVGLASVGGSVVVANITTPIQAIVDDGATIRAVDDINIVSDFDANGTGKAYGGTGGLVNLGAQVVKIKDTSSQLTTIDTGAKIEQGTDVTIKANAKRYYMADSVGVNVGAATAGAAVALVDVGGTTAADLNTNVAIGQASGVSVGNLTVEATSSTEGTAKTKGVSAGMGAALQGAAATFTVNPTVRAQVNTGVNVLLTGNGIIRAASFADVNSDALGVSVSGGVAIGVSVSRADVNSDVVAAVRGANFVANGNVTLRATHNVEDNDTNRGWKAEADGNSSGGGLLAGNGAEVTAISMVDVDAVATGTIQSTGGDLSIISRSNNDADADGKGIVIGGVAIGAIITTAQTGGTTQARATSPNLTGANNKAITIRAVSQPSATATSLAAAGGIAAGAGNNSTASDNTITSATANDVTITGGNVTITANTAPTADATTLGVSAGALAVGVSESIASVTPTVTATVGGAVTITASSLTLDATQSLPDGDKTADARATASGGGLIGVNSTKATASNNATINAYARDGSTFNVTNGISLQASTLSKQDADASSNGGGVIGVGASKATATASGTTNAYLGKNINVVAGSLNITANGVDENYAETTAGTGGVVAGSALRPIATSTATTKAYIDEGSANKVIDLNQRGTGQLSIVASHTGQVNVKGISNGGGVLAGTGADMDTSVTSTVEATIGNNVRVVAKDIDVLATNTARKPDIGQNIDGTTGGVAAAAGVDSDTVISLDTKTNIGNNASVTTTSPTQGLVMKSLNVFDLVDKSSFTTGGALSGAGLDVSITSTQDKSTVNIGTGATLTSAGTLDLFAQGTGTANAVTNSETYGAATVAVGLTKVDIRPENTININGTVKADNDINLMSGTGKDFARDQYDINATNDTFAGSVIPISSLDAIARLKMTNNINVLAGSLVESAGKMFINAEKIGFAKMNAKAKTTSWISGVSGAIDSALGGNSAAMFKGTIDTGASGNVLVNGTVRTGSKRNRSLVLNTWDYTTGTITGSTASEGVTFTSQQQLMNSSLQNDLDFAQAQLNKYGTQNATLATFYQNEITRIVNELSNAGQYFFYTINLPSHGYNTGDAVVYNVTSGNAILGLTNGTTYYVIRQTANTISLATTAANATTGSGTAIAMARISSTGANHTLTRSSVAKSFASSALAGGASKQQYAMVANINNIRAEAGRIDVRADQLFGSGVLDAPRDASITITNNTPAQLKLNEVIIPEGTGGVYMNGVQVANNTNITSNNSADSGTALGAVNFSSVTPISTATDPTIVITQNSYTPDGRSYPRPAILVTGNIDNLSGNLTLTNNIPQGDITITARVRAKNQTVTAGGSVFIDNVTSYSIGGEAYSKWKPVTDITHVSGVNAAANTAITNVVNTPLPSTPNMYGDRIVIQAQYLNLNGLMQSGKDGVTLTLGASATTEIDNIRRSGKAGIIKLMSVSTSDVEVYYNTTMNRIEVSDMRVSGGYIDITANVINTGKGEIRALSGYGAININNNTNLDVMLNRVDVSQKGQGTIIIKDIAKGSVANPAVTIFDQAAGYTGTYTPKANMRYGWTIGQEKFERTTTTYGTSGWLGIDALAPDPSTIRSQSTETIGQPVLMGAGPYYFESAGGENYRFNSGSENVTQPETRVDARWETSTWYGETTYYTRTITETRVRDLWTHSIRADRPIDIRMIGATEGTVNVTSPNGRIITNGAILNTGSTTLNSGRSIESQGSGAAIGGKVVTLTATGGIGNNGPVYTNLSDDSTAAFRATSANGGVNVNEISGNLPVDYINANAGQNTFVTAQGSIIRSTTTNGTQQIRGNSITLTAVSGSIGVDSRDIKIETGSTNTSVLTANAPGEIALTELTGDLRIKQVISSTGAVKLNIPGIVIDANDSETRDERTITQLRDTVWSDLQLTAGTGAQDKINQLYTAFAANKEREYRAYWVYRSMQADPSTFDPNFVIPLSAAEENFYRNELGFDTNAINALILKRTTEYRDLHTRYGSLGNTYNESYTYTLTPAEQTQVAGTVRVWTEDQLMYALGGGLLKKVTDTQTTIEEPNISGAAVSVTAGGAIGNTSGQVVINVGTPMTNEQRIALAAAERNDVKFYNGNTEVVDIEDPAAVITKIVVDQREDINVNATGIVTISAGADAFIGSEQNIALNTFSAVGQARLKTSQGITNGAAANVTNITTGDLVLEAANGGIGSSAAPISMDLQAAATLTARAQNGVYIEEKTGNINLVSLYSEQGDASLKAQGSILDTVQTTTDKIDAVNIRLEAGGSIGEAGDAFEVNAATSGQLYAKAGGLIKIVETFGDMNIDHVESTGGDVDLQANVSMYDVDGNGTADVIGNNVKLNAVLGGIGESGNDLDLNTANAAAGVLQTYSNLNTYLTETAGDLTITTIDTAPGYVASILSAGKILNGNANATAPNVNSGRTKLFAAGDIGASSKPLQTTVGFIEGKSTGGSVYIINTGAVDIGGSEPNGIDAWGGIFFTANSPITVSNSVIAHTGDVNMQSTDHAGNGDGFSVTDGESIVATNGNIIINSGDDVTLPASSAITASGIVSITGDYNDADPGQGVNFSLLGTITGNGGITITGGNDNDTIRIASIGANSPTTVNMGDGDDTFTMQGNTSQLADLRSSVTLDGGTGTNPLTITDTGSTTDQSGTLTSTTLAGFSMGGVITYQNMTTLHLTLGQANDTLNVESTAAIPNTIMGGNGNDTINVKTIAGPTNINTQVGDDTINIGSNSNQLNGINALLTVSGGSSNNTLNITDTGSTTGQSGTLTNNTLTGFSMGGSISYIAMDALNLHMGQGGDTLNVESTAAIPNVINANDGADTLNVKTISGVTTVNGGNGADVFNITSNAQMLNGIQAAMTINGNADSDTVNFSDVGNNVAQTGVLTSTTLTGFSMGGTITYGSMDALNLTMGQGNDQLNVESTAAIPNVINASSGLDVVNVKTIDGPTTLNGGNGNDTINVGSNANRLNGINAVLLVNGDGDADRLNITDTGSTTDQAGVLTYNMLTGFSMGGYIQYETVDTLHLTMGQANDTLDVESTAAIPNTILGGTGNDTVNVKTISGPTIVNTQQDNDTINVTSNQSKLNGIQALLTINGAEGTDTINATDTASTVGQVGTLTVNTLTGFGMTGGIFFDTDEFMNLYMGQGDDRLEVTGTTPVTRIEGQGGNDAIVVSSDGFTGMGNLDQVTGELTIDSGAGNNNTLVFGDRTGTSNVNVEITNNKITGLAPADINYTATGGQFNDATGNAGVFIRGSNGGVDNMAIRSTRESSTYTVEGNAGSDFIRVGNLTNSLDDIRGKLIIYGDNDPGFSASGSNTGDQDTVTFNDFDDASPNMIYEWTYETVHRTDLLHPITYRSSEQMNLNTGTSSNTVNVRSTTDYAQTNIRMLAGNDTVNVDSTGVSSDMNVWTREGDDAVNMRNTGLNSTSTVNTAEGNDFITLSSNANLNNNPGTMSGLNGTITLDAGIGTQNRLVMDDRAGGDNINAIITRDTVTGLAPATIYYAASGGNFTNPGGTGNGIYVRGSNAEADRFLIPSTLNGSTIEVEGNGGSDRYEVGSTPMANNGDLDAVQGRLRLTAGANDLGRDEVFINDRAKVGRANYTIDPISVTAYVLPTNFVAPIPLQPVVNPLRPLFAGIDYDGTMEYLRMDGTDDVNIFNVSPSVDTEMHFDGNLLKSGGAYFGGGDYLMLNTNGTTGRKIRITDLGVGSWVFTSPHKQVGFEEIERFNHVESVASGAVAGPSNTPMAGLRDSETNELKFRVLTMENTFRGGVNVTTGDVNRDGFPDLIVGAGSNRVGNIKIYDGTPDANGNYSGKLLANFNPFGTTYKSGVTVATGDLNADGQVDLIVGSGPGSAPIVKAFDGLTVLSTTRTMLNNGFYPFATTFRGGVNVAVGDINNDGYADIISGTGWTTTLGTVGTIVVNNGRNFARMKSFQPFGSTYKGAVHVSVGDINGDTVLDIIAARGKGQPPEIRFFNGTQMFTTAATVLLGTIAPFPTTLRTGVQMVSKSTTGGNPGFVEHTSILVAPDAGAGSLARTIREVTWNPTLLKLTVTNRFTEGTMFNGVDLG